MALPAVIADLPEEFAAVSDSVRQLALDSAYDGLPISQLSAVLGEETASRAQVLAASHFLAIAGHGTSTGAGQVTSERVGDVATTFAAIASDDEWSGSWYGQALSRILDKLPRRNGRGRRYPMAVG